MPRRVIVSLMGQHSYGDCFIETTDRGNIAVFYSDNELGLVFPTVEEALNYIDTKGWSSSDRWRFFHGWLIKLTLEGKFGYWFVWPAAAVIVLKANIKRLFKRVFR